MQIARQKELIPLALGRATEAPRHQWRNFGFQIPRIRALDLPFFDFFLISFFFRLLVRDSKLRCPFDDIGVKSILTLSKTQHTHTLICICVCCETLNLLKFCRLDSVCLKGNNATVVQAARVTHNIPI